MFNRKRTASPVTDSAPESTLGCTVRGCPNGNATLCPYRDRRGHECGSAFCPDHSVVVNGVRFCRRHAGTMRALGSRGRHRAALPDVGNRGPSLVNFIADEVNDFMVHLLETAARPDEHVVADAEVEMAFDADRNPRWERSWRLLESTGVLMKITVSVDDRQDSTVTVRVGSEMVADGVPPWVQRHARGELTTAAADKAERELFYRFIRENVTAAVSQLRVREEHPTWV
ncbi:MAG: hypothetical protein ABR498_04670 [Candidatus Dormibacteria bacterium]